MKGDCTDRGSPKAKRSGMLAKRSLVVATMLVAFTLLTLYKGFRRTEDPVLNINLGITLETTVLARCVEGAAEYCCWRPWPLSARHARSRVTPAAAAAQAADGEELAARGAARPEVQAGKVVDCDGAGVHEDGAQKVPRLFRDALLFEGHHRRLPLLQQGLPAPELPRQRGLQQLQALVRGRGRRRQHEQQRPLPPLRPASKPNAGRSPRSRRAGTRRSGTACCRTWSAWGGPTCTWSRTSSRSPTPTSSS